MTSTNNPTTDLQTLLARAKAVIDAMSPAQRAEMHRAQRRSFVVSEMGMGSDADEAAYRAALDANDTATLARLDTEAKQRMDAATRYLDERGL